MTLAIGDRVVSGAGVSCGTCEWCRAGRINLCAAYYTLGLHANGGLAERVATPAAICCRVPDDCTDDAAAMAQPLAVALHALSRVAQRAGDSVAVIGAGGIGSFIVAGASHVPKARKATRPSRASKKKRLESKIRRGRIKQLRGKFELD